MTNFNQLQIRIKPVGVSSYVVQTSRPWWPFWHTMHECMGLIDRVVRFDTYTDALSFVRSYQEQERTRRKHLGRGPVRCA